MNKMLRIMSVALFVSLISLPDNLFAQTVSESEGGFTLSGPMMIIAGIVIVLKVTLIFRLIINKKKLERVK